MNNQEEIKYLLERYVSGNATEDERQRLFGMLDGDTDTATWELLIRQIAEQQPPDPDYEAARWEPVIAAILRKGGPQINRRMGRLRSLVSLPRAAAAIILLGIGAWLAISHGQRPAPAVAAVTNFQNDIPPGGNKAVLTLANGQTVILDNISNDTIAAHGGTKIIKLNNGQLTCSSREAESSHSGAAIAYYTLRTPRGGQYQIVLPDGSKAWLNAASSIRFPAAFPGSERRVFIKGEVYFEVAKNAAKPFIVSVNDMEVKVLGTHFNVMAYANEPATETTLLEGAVEVIKGTQTARLRPDQQARLDNHGGIRLISNVDASETVAWKEGLFQFTDAGIADIMRQIARWYDVEIVYADGVPAGHITGKIPRNTNLSEVLKMMQLSGIHFKIEGRKVIVSPT